jgi:hypothetical protein
MEATRRCWRTASAWPAEQSSISPRTGSTPRPANSAPTGDSNGGVARNVYTYAHLPIVAGRRWELRGSHSHS